LAKEAVDAVCVALLFEEKVAKFEPQNQLTDVFFLTGHQMFRRLGSF